MLNLLWHCGAVLSGLGISESVEFHVVVWVSFCVVFVCVLFVLFFSFHRHLAFLLTYARTCGNSQSKTRRFYDRLSFERARHGHKKKKGAALLAFVKEAAFSDALGRSTPRAPCRCATGILLLRSYREDTDLPHVITRRARGCGSLCLGTYDAPTRCLLLKILGITPHCDIHNSFREVREGGQPLGQRITRQLKSNHLTLGKDKTCSWRGQFELGNT